MNVKFHVFVLLLVALTSIVSAFVVHAQTNNAYDNHPLIQDLKKEIGEKEHELQTLAESTKSYERKIEEARSQGATLRSQLSLIDNQVTKLELDIKTTQVTIDKAKLEIESLEFQIAEEEGTINAQKDQLREYIKLINKEDQRNLLEILLVNDSFSDFFKQLNYIEEIQSDLKQSIDRVTLLKESLEVKKAEMENYQRTLEASKEELEDRQLRLKEQLVAKESLLFETKSSEIRYQNLLAESVQMQREVDSSIKNITEEIQRKIINLRSGSTDPKTTLLYWPVDPSRGITTYFNDPTYPFRHLFEHSALDIRAYQGTPLRAPADAYVARAADNGYGYSYITLVHDNGLSSVFGHVSRIDVVPDQFVKAGDIVGLSGGQPGTRGAGNLTTGPHLHFEIRLNGIPVDPLLYLP